MRGVISRLIDRRIAAYQNGLLLKHYEEIRNIYGQMRGWRHDYHNQIQAMKAYIALGRPDELSAYLDELDADLASVDPIIKTGNLMLDAILNSKLSLAAAKGIGVNAKASAPAGLKISDVDICAIIGNLLDNAIEACEKIPEAPQRFIRVYVGQFKGHFYISVTNSTRARPTIGKRPSAPAEGGEYAISGEHAKNGKPAKGAKHAKSGEFSKGGMQPAKAAAGYLSAKGGYHGYGLKRIDGIVGKYGGYVNRQHEDGVFATEIMI